MLRSRVVSFFRGNNLISQKWSSSTSATNPVLNPPPAVQQTSNKAGPAAAPSKEPAWVQSAIDRQIYKAKDLKSLATSVNGKGFNGKNAINFIGVVSRWVNEGTVTVADFQRLEARNTVEKLLVEGGFNVSISTTLQAIRNLMSLGFPATSLVVSSLENELLWQLRKVTLNQHFQVMAFHNSLPHKETEMWKKVMRETAESVQRRWVEMKDARDFASLFHFSSHFNPKFVDKMEDVLVELVEGFSQEEKTKIIVALGASKRRTTPLLRALSYHLNKSGETLDVRASSDVLFALNRLSFRDEVLIERICTDLVTQLTPEVKSSVIGSLFTSLGQLRYRHEGVLEALSEWMNQNWAQTRKHDVVSLLLGLAAVNFVPSTWDSLWPKVSKLLGEELKSPTWSDNVLLDVAWSLAVLDHLEPVTAQAVINDKFIAKLLGSNAVESNNKGVKLKLNQIWALCHLKGWALISDVRLNKLPFIFEKDEEVTTQSTHPQFTLSQSIMNALANFIPAEKYLRRDVQSPLGIPLDGECILNDQCVPLVLAEYDQGNKPLPPNNARIAIMVLDYKDLCMGRSQLTGVQGLRERLLQMSGYRVVKIRHTEFDPKEKLVKKVQYLEQLMKTALQQKH